MKKDFTNRFSLSNELRSRLNTSKSPDLPKMHEIGHNINNTRYYGKVLVQSLDSRIHVAQEIQLKNFRFQKQEFAIERVPDDLILEFEQKKQEDIEKRNRRVKNKYFPLLEDATNAYYGQTRGSYSTKNQAAHEIEKMSNTVKLVCQVEDPHPARIRNKQRQDFLSESPQIMRQSTLSRALKERYLVRSRHPKVKSEQFYPTSTTQAKRAIQTAISHTPGIYIDFDVSYQRETQSKLIEQLPGLSVFKSAGPQDVLYKTPRQVLNGGTSYTTYITPKSRIESRGQQKADENPRIQVLDNFKEIQRMLTQNFLKNKKLQGRYGLSPSVKEQINSENESQNRFKKILQKLQNTSNFVLPVQKESPFQDLRVSDFDVVGNFNF